MKTLFVCLALLLLCVGIGFLFEYLLPQWVGIGVIIFLQVIILLAVLVSLSQRRDGDG